MKFCPPLISSKRKSSSWPQWTLNYSKPKRKISLNNRWIFSKLWVSLPTNWILSAKDSSSGISSTSKTKNWENWKKWKMRIWVTIQRRSWSRRVRPPKKAQKSINQPRVRNPWFSVSEIGSANDRPDIQQHQRVELLHTIPLHGKWRRKIRLPPKTQLDVPEKPKDPLREKLRHASLPPLCQGPLGAELYHERGRTITSLPLDLPKRQQTGRRNQQKQSNLCSPGTQLLHSVQWRMQFYHLLPWSRSPSPLDQGRKDE